MSQDPHTTKPASGTGSDGPESASTPAVGISGGSRGLNGPQAGAHGFQGERNAANPYRVLVTGSRDWQTIGIVRGALDEVLGSLPADQPLVVVHGDCPTGADIMAKVWALTTFTPQDTDDYERVTQEAHPAAWHAHGRQAGPIRNKAMVDKGADIALAFIRDGSRGASHTARLAEQAGIPTRRFTG